MGKTKIRKQVSFDSGLKEVVAEEIKKKKKVGSSSKTAPILTNRILLIPIHYALNLAGMFWFGLMENTQKTLLKGALNLAVMQIAYDYLIVRLLKTSAKDSTNTPLLVIGSIIVCLLLSFPLSVLLIILGAPVTSHLYLTYLLALHLSLIVINPILVVYQFQLDKFYQSLQFSNDSQVFKSVILKSSILLSAFLAVLGTWLGVIPIPLDWDRPWQAWPITLVTGGYTGAFLGGLISCMF
ncbi:Glycosylphosphatidylinositol (GPI) anchor assembly protein [Scheffersomyces spartinae]|uniref:Glycosylphosphatidylinositol anchor biosynthesis protein 11 n=1 Tax=Scheffersomyces spartinae TaxID=45513 RepID=A0A9P8AGA7_9ASCO|nr:Glycosylphosphatidylinositol (GPI) anchor assembly protein [Scheffersomyces spartinae]KAG7191484.1 Glycosylphosphatidylinositol (GPI) anchor assembly protein [Scheffersomyces spartinae]